MIINVHKKETIYFFIMSAISMVIYAGICFCLLTVRNIMAIVPFAIYACFFLAIYKLGSLLLLGHLKGNAVKINEKQFPDIYAIVKEHASRLELDRIPDVYLLQGNGLLNAFAIRLSKRDFVVLYSDVLEVAYQQEMSAVSFIIGHELGHIKREHVSGLSAFLIWPASWIPFMNFAYSRAREYTCDNIGFALCPHAGAKGLLLLAAGKKLYNKVSVEQLLSDDSYKVGLAARLAEAFATHPPLLKRIDAINKQYEHHLTSQESCVVSPHITYTEDARQLQS